MTTYHFINDLEKAEVTVKPFYRKRRGKIEQVKGHTRYVLGQPISVTEQSEWIKKQKNLLEDIKSAFLHADLNEIEAVGGLIHEFGMSHKEASTYIEQWKEELKAKSAKFNEQLKEEIKQKFIEGQNIDDTINELQNKGVVPKEWQAVEMVGKWQTQFIDELRNKMDVNKELFGNKVDLLSESVNNLPQKKIDALTQLKKDLLEKKYDTYSAITRVNWITGWWLEASSLLVFSWEQKAKLEDDEFLNALKKDFILGLGDKQFIQESGVIKLLESKGYDNAQIEKLLVDWKAEVKPISLSIPPPPPELLNELKLSPEAVLDISNSTLEKWAKLTEAQHKEIEQVKKQFFYYKLNKTNALSRLVFITGIGQVGDKQGIEDLNKILDEWKKNKYKYSKEKTKYSKGKKEKPVEVPTEGYEYPKGKVEKPAEIKPPTSLGKPIVSQTVLPENLVSTGEGQKGSNPGGVYTDKQTGKKYYVKAYSDKQGADSGSAQARVEQLSNKIYKHLGIATTTTELVMMKDFGKLCIASEWIEGAQKVPTVEQEHSKDVINGFVVDAYLKNWDVAGLEYDNIVKNPATGQLIRQDNGGTMMFRAQGSPKEFEPDKILELDSMRNPQHGAGKVFKGVTDADIKDQAQYLVSTLKESDIERLVDESGLSGTIKEKALNGLKGRRQTLIEKYALQVPTEEQTVFALYEGGTTAMKEGFTAVGTHHSAVKGKLLAPIPGFEDIEFFQYKNAKGEYGIAEKTTGLVTTSGTFPTEKEALDKLKENLTKYGYEYTKKQISEWEHKAPQMPHESALKAWTQPDYKLPNGKKLNTGDWIKYSHANTKHHYKVTTIYSNNKLHIEEWDNWDNKVQEFDMTITPDIDKTTAPKPLEKSPPPSVAITPEIFKRIDDVWAQAKEITKINYDAPTTVPKIKEFNENLRKAFQEIPYVFRAVTKDSFHKSMQQILKDNVLTGSSHVQGTTCCSISPWSSLGFGSYIFVFDKKKLVNHSDWVKPIQYFNYTLENQDPKTFKGKSHEHEDIYNASYVKEMEVRAKHIHDPLSVISEVWVHKEGATEEDKWKLIEEIETEYTQLKGKVKVLNIYKDLPWPKEGSMAKSIKRSLEGLKW